MPAYNLTNLTQNTTGLLSLTQNVNNTLMFGWLGTLLLIGLAVVYFMSFLFTTGDTKRSIAATGFLSFVTALFLKIIGLIPDIALYIALVLAAASLAFSWRR